jgi:hypothetical protein
VILGHAPSTVEGYPEPVEAVPAALLYHGALSTYETLAFIRDRPSANIAGS